MVRSQWSASPTLIVRCTVSNWLWQAGRTRFNKTFKCQIFQIIEYSLRDHLSLWHTAIVPIERIFRIFHTYLFCLLVGLNCVTLLNRDHVDRMQLLTIIIYIKCVLDRIYVSSVRVCFWFGLVWFVFTLFVEIISKSKHIHYWRWQFYQKIQNF